MATALHNKIMTLVGATSTVTSVVGARVFRLRAQQATVTPYVLISSPTGSIPSYLGGPTDLENTQIRFDLYGTSVTVLDQLRSDIITMMCGATTFSAVPSMHGELYDDETRLYHLIQDFSVWNYR